MLADKPPVMVPVTTGADQLYNVPMGTIPLIRSVGVTVNVTPLQLTVHMAVITAVRLIITVTVNVRPVQFPEVGVTVYTAVCAEFNGFVSNP